MKVANGPLPTPAGTRSLVTRRRSSVPAAKGGTYRAPGHTSGAGSARLAFLFLSQHAEAGRRSQHSVLFPSSRSPVIFHHFSRQRPTTPLLSTLGVQHYRVVPPPWRNGWIGGNSRIRQNSSVKFLDNLRGWYHTTPLAARRGTASPARGRKIKRVEAGKCRGRPLAAVYFTAAGQMRKGRKGELANPSRRWIYPLNGGCPMKVANTPIVIFYPPTTECP